MKRALATLATLTLLAPLGACRVEAHNEEQYEACPAGSKHLIFSIDVFRTRPDSGADVMWETPLSIVVDAKSPDPEFNGIIWFDAAAGPPVGTVQHNPVTIEHQFSPYGGQLCWPVERPVGILIRAFLEDVPSQAYDRLHCDIEDGENLHVDGFDFLDEGVREVGTADLIDWDRRAAGGGGVWFGVQCQYIYIPGGYQGDPIAPFRELDT